MKKNLAAVVARTRTLISSIFLLMVGLGAGVVCLIIWVADLVFGLLILEIFLLAGLAALCHGYIQRHVRKNPSSTL